MTHTTLELNKLFTGFSKYLSILSYTIYNGISKFQRKISRKTVIIIGTVFLIVLLYCGYVVNVSTQQDFNASEAAALLLRNKTITIIIIMNV